MKIALVDDDPRALAQLEQYLTEQLGRETEISPLARRRFVCGHQFPGIDKLGLPVCVRVLKCVSPVFSLALSGS